MGHRLQLQSLLEQILGSTNVYFQPGPKVEMKYPCIVYQRDFASTQHADNAPYRLTKRYQVTTIDRNPDSVVPDLIAQLPTCEFSRFFAADGLNHDVYDLYF